MRLVGCGDSWCWGAELVDPIEEPIPIMNLPGGGHERHYKPINEKYRLSHRYLNLFAQKCSATEIVDLSRASYSNDAITRTLIEWLSTEGYLTGRDTSELFITIGWTSPERREFYFKEPFHHEHWIGIGPWVYDYDYGDDDINKFMRLYFEHFWHETEFLHRWILQVWQTETMLKKLNIKYVMHQAFYHHYQQMIYQWDDNKYRENLKYVSPGDKIIWDNIDSTRFINKDDPNLGTMHHYILSQVNGDTSKVFEVFHPNSLGHKIWADFLHDYCVKENLL